MLKYSILNTWCVPQCDGKQQKKKKKRNQPTHEKKGRNREKSRRKKSNSLKCAFCFIRHSSIWLWLVRFFFLKFFLLICVNSLFFPHSYFYLCRNFVLSPSRVCPLCAKKKNNGKMTFNERKIKEERSKRANQNTNRAMWKMCRTTFN